MSLPIVPPPLPQRGDGAVRNRAEELADEGDVKEARPHGEEGAHFLTKIRDLYWGVPIGVSCFTSLTSISAPKCPVELLIASAPHLASLSLAVILPAAATLPPLPALRSLELAHEVGVGRLLHQLLPSFSAFTALKLTCTWLNDVPMRLLLATPAPHLRALDVQLGKAPLDGVFASWICPHSHVSHCASQCSLPSTGTY